MSQQINLFNPAFSKQKKVFSALAMARALGVLLFGVLALVFYARQNVAELERVTASGAELLAKREQNLAAARRDFAPRPKSVALEAEVAEARARLQALRDISGVIERGELGNTKGYAEYFKALARQNLNGVWLTGVSISGAGLDVSVQGRALDPTLVSAYLGRLAHEPALHGKAFGSLRISQTDSQPVSQPRAAGSAAAKPGSSAAAPYVDFSLESTLVEADK